MSNMVWNWNSVSFPNPLHSLPYWNAMLYFICKTNVIMCIWISVSFTSRFASGNSACSCQPASWVGNAVTKIYQTDKEGRHSNVSQADVRDHSYLGAGNNALRCIAALWNPENWTPFSFISAFSVALLRPKILFFPSAQSCYLLNFLLPKPHFSPPCSVYILSYYSLPPSDTGPCFPVPLFAFHLDLLHSFTTELD